MRILLLVFILLPVSPSFSAEPLKQFGDKITLKNPLNFKEATAQFDKIASSEILIQGQVEKVCEKKGCWLTLKSKTQASVRVVFKDYGFFVPKDILNKKVLLQGILTRQIVSVKDQKHYLKDEKASAEQLAQIKEPKTKYKFVASGVQVL